MNRNNSRNNNNAKNSLAINGEIREPRVRLVGVDGEALGVVSGREAQELADKAELDLVMIAPQGDPPVCRIMDYGKFRFDQSKREKDQRKHQQQTELKEVRLSLNIDDHDFDTKVGHARKFLKAGNKVKVTIRFKGREVTHLDLGKKLMERFKQSCAEFGVFDEKPSKLEGRFYAAVIFPKVADKAAKSKSAKPETAKPGSAGAKPETPVVKQGDAEAKPDVAVAAGTADTKE